ncbi:MAG: glycosyltransferase family 9 protein [Bacteroidota bacterium]
MKFLILRFSSIGDIVLTTPVMRCLRKAMPDAEIHFCTKKAFAGILAPNPNIDKLHLLDADMPDLIARLKAEQFDMVIDLHNNLRTRRIKWALGVKACSYNKLNIQKWLYVNFRIDTLPKVHIVHRYLETLRKLNVPDDGLGLDFFIEKDSEINLSEIPESHRLGYSAVVIGAQHFTKRLPPERIAELCISIPGPVILLGGPEDKLRGEEILEILTSHAGKVFNACGKFSLQGSASLVKEANLVFSHDTGLMHIAAAFGKTIYSIWGNTTPKFGMYPFRTPYVVWENNKLTCRPCSKIGYAACPKGHFKCMKDINFTFNQEILHE